MVIPASLVALYLLLALLSYLCTVCCEIGARGLMCYTCMSDNVPEISKDIMRQTINIPDYATTRACNDPFVDGTYFHSGIRMEPCDTACIKVHSENKYLKVILRGCLNKLYNPGYLGFPLPDSTGTYRDTCDVQRQSSTGIGNTVTDTCLCVNHYCNKSSVSRIALLSTTIPLILAIVIL